MELRHLRYFAAVAEELNFTRAAKRLHIAQPPLSQQVRALEAELGVTLFSRSHHRVELTAAGVHFLRDARDILTRAEDATKRVRLAAKGHAGELRLGFVTTAMFEDTVPRLLREFRQLYPSVMLHLEQLSTVEQVQALLARRIDAGFIRPPTSEPQLTLRTVTREPLVMTLPAAHPLAQRRRVSLRAFATESWVIISRDMASGFYQQTLELCTQAGFTPKLTMEVGEIQTVVGLVAAGFGVALLPAAVSSLHHSGAVYVPLSAPGATAEVSIAYLSGVDAPVLARFLDLLGTEARRGAHKP